MKLLQSVDHTKKYLFLPSVAYPLPEWFKSVAIILVKCEKAGVYNALKAQLLRQNVPFVE